MDGEFHLDPLPSCVREVTMELHLTHPAWRAEAAPALVARLFAGWEVVRAPKFEGGHWNTIGA